MAGSGPGHDGGESPYYGRLVLQTRLGRLVIACSLGTHYQPLGAAGLVRILARIQEGVARKTR